MGGKGSSLTSLELGPELLVEWLASRSFIYRGGQKEVYSCESEKHRVNRLQEGVNNEGRQFEHLL